MTLGDAGVLVAFGAGVVSFVSPCILPIIPSFLSYLGGIVGADLSQWKTARFAVLKKVCFFVLGFSLVFVALGTLFSGVGWLLGGARATVNRVAGLIVVFFGLNMMFDFWKVLTIERRFHFRHRPLGALGSVAVGLAFGAGWTPCVGPVLASILFMAGTSGKVGQGTLLLGAYSLGLGAPFLVAGAFFGWFLRQAHRLRAHMHAIKIGSGALLVVIGVAIFAGSLSRLNAAFFGLAGDLQDWRSRQPLAPRLLFGGVFGALAAGTVVSYARRVVRTRAVAWSSAPSLIYPVPLAMLLVLLALSILSFSNMLQPDQFIVSWLRFQGV